MVFIWLGEGIDEGPNVATCIVMHILFVLILKPKSLIFLAWKQIKCSQFVMILKVFNMVFIIRNVIWYLIVY